MPATLSGIGNVERYKIVSADGHNIEPPHMWTTYLPKAYRDRAPRLVKDPKGGDAWELVRGAEPMPIGLVTNQGQWGRRYEDNDWWGSTYESVRRGAFEGPARLEEQDIDGVDAEVIFPSQRTMGVFMAQEDDGFHVAGVQAYNEWLRKEFCAADPTRLIGLAQMPAIGADVAVEALKDAKAAGFHGVIISGYPSGGDALSEADDPFWAAAEALRVPVHIHSGLSQAGKRQAGKAGMKGFGGRPTLQQMGGAIGGASDIVSRLIYSEMFDRFPNLKIVLAETGAGWVPNMLEHMDDHWWRDRVWAESHLKMIPSEYFRRNFMVTFIREPFAVLNRYFIGVDNMMWSHDYPHHRHDWPYSRRIIEESFINVPAHEKHAMIAGNAVKLYGLEKYETAQPLMHSAPAA